MVLSFNVSAEMDHSVHLAAMESSQKRSVANYVLPSVSLVDQNRVVNKLENFLSSDKFLVVDFIFTTCTTVCPVLSSGLAYFHKKLGDDASKVQFVSITIDPEHDKPDILKDYSRKYKLPPDHVLLTGSRSDINKVMKAFDAVMSDKMTHYPLTFFRASDSQEWVRVFGLMSVSDMMKEYKHLTQM